MLCVPLKLVEVCVSKERWPDTQGYQKIIIIIIIKNALNHGLSQEIEVKKINKLIMSALGIQNRLDSW